LYYFLRFLTATTWKELKMIAEKSPTLKAAVARVEELNLDPRTIERAALHTMAEQAYQAEFKQERSKGERDKALEVASKLLRAKSTLDFVAEISGLSLEEVQDLAAEINAEQRA
jgi:predicted transposase/invertase (TIGR01784 family)